MQLRDLSYAQQALQVLKVFLDDYERARLQGHCQAAYSEAVFPGGVAPLNQLSDDLFLIELWHGPTAAFKDVALQLMPRLLAEAAAGPGGGVGVFILVATSGDTGKAALAGFQDVPGTRVVVFYPQNGVSEAQRLQMVTQEGDNLHVIGVEGDFDDAQSGVKRLFTDSEVTAALKRRGWRFSSANSINWGRLVPQIVYYVSSYVELCRRRVIRPGSPVNIAVPTGNFGNILAAYYAHLLGVPVGRLICAANSNNVLTDFIRTGVYDRRRALRQTISPSMDILISSNLERLLYELCDRDPKHVTGWMTALAENGWYRLSQHYHQRLQELFWSDWASEERTLAAIEGAWHQYGCLLDPHTAVGLHVVQSYRQKTGDRRPVLLAATASPFKFSRSVLRALTMQEPDAGSETDLQRRLSRLTGLEPPPQLLGLERRPVRHRQICRPEEMKQSLLAVIDTLKEREVSCS